MESEKEEDMRGGKGDDLRGPNAICQPLDLLPDEDLAFNSSKMLINHQGGTGLKGGRRFPVCQEL